MTIFRKAAARPGARPLEGRYYTDAAVFRAEQERIFARRWLCVGRAEQVAEPGAYLLAEVGGESLIVVRDQAGTPRAFYNVCRHRGSRLCTEPHGRLAGSIQCPYHAWTYGLDGRLLAARHMEGVAGFDRSEHGLVPAVLAEWEGFLFLSLAAEPEPFASAFAPLLGRFARWQLAGLRGARRLVYDVAANWKLLFENYNECYHCPLLHPQLEALSRSDSGRNDLSEGPFLGGYSTLRPGVDSLTEGGGTPRPPLGTVGDDDRTRVYYYTIFPNLFLSLHPDYAMAHVLSPLAPDRTRVECVWLFDPATLAAPGFDPADAVTFWDRTNRQDWKACEWTQAGVTSRAYTPGLYATGEGLLDAFDRHYLEAMGPLD